MPIDLSVSTSPKASRVFEAIGQAAEELGQDSFVVGGYVRDAILCRENEDVDVVTLGSGIELARLTAKRLGSPKVSIFKRFGTAHFRYGDLEVEFVGARKESYRSDSRKPIVEDGTLEDDLSRRDFTINALAIRLNGENAGELIDLFKGEEDIELRTIRTPLDPYVTFDDDPLRMLRAIRFASQLYFKIVPEALVAIRDRASRISIVSMERVMDEFNKILLSPEPSIGLALLFETGLLKEFFPELAALSGVENVEGRGHKDNFYHTLQVVDNVALQSGDLWLRWAALLHDIGKAQTKRYVQGHGWTFHSHEFVGSKMVPRIFRQLRLPQNEKMRFVQKMVSLHMRPIALTDEEVTDSAVRRLLFDASDDIEHLMTLCEADITSKNPQKVARYLNNFRRVRAKLRDIEERDAVRNFQPPISGEYIMEVYGLSPCREVGIIKSAIKEAILDGIISNNLEEAEAYMRSKAEELGLKPKE
ncbi:MAG: tRNA nucleotidyltransferase [Bacteroidetes bacterium]|nr:MAG: tRNA nucleotidyltransferase [Bacteroidota bacterium]